MRVHIGDIMDNEKMKVAAALNRQYLRLLHMDDGVLCGRDKAALTVLRIDMVKLINSIKRDAQ